MISVRQAAMPGDRAAVQDLFAEYLRWVCPRVYDEYQAEFDAESILAHDMQTINIFMPPQGLLYLAYQDGSLAGCACTRRIGGQIAELKRMYVRPSFRRSGIGRMLVSETVKAVQQLGYSFLRLDSAGFMSDAHALYRSIGFQDRTQYEESEIPPEYRQHWVFMELEL